MRNRTRIGIIGSGWFGCHLAYVLKQKGFEVKIFEKNKNIFSGASGNNTGRLHKGFHYPRSKETRNQTSQGFLRFEEMYPMFLYKVNQNIYGISNSGSHIDWNTYKDVLLSSGLQFEEKEPQDLGLDNLTGALICDEYFIDHEMAKRFFERNLNEEILYNYTVKDVSENEHSISIDNKYDFDLVIDCTYGAFRALKDIDVQYELIQLPIFENVSKNINFSYVVMDGDFQTLSPFRMNTMKASNLFSLYDVNFSRICVSDNYSDIDMEYKSIYNGSDSFKVLNADQIIEKAEHFYPEFSKNFKLIQGLLTTRAIHNDKNADRTCKLEFEGRMVSVFSGKINTIFAAENALMEYLSLEYA